MSRKPPQLDEVLNLVGAVYAAALEPQGLPKSLSVLNKTMQGEFSQMFTWHHETGTILNSTIDDETALLYAHDEYVREWAQKDPRTGPMIGLASERVMRCDELFSPAFVNHDSFFQEFLIPSGIRWALAGAFDSGKGTSTIVANVRAPDTDTYEDWTAVLLTKLMPHFQRSALIAERLDHKASGDINTGAVLNAIPAASLLTEWHGRYILANPLFAEALAELGGSVRGQNLQFSNADLQAAWIGGVRNTIEHGWPATFFHRGVSGTNWKVSLTPWRHVLAHTDLYESRLVLCTFDALAGQAVQSFNAGWPDLKFSAAEQQVIGCILKGMAIKAIARERRTSPNTVRSQIASILRKSDCVSQKDLIAKLTGRGTQGG